MTTSPTHISRTALRVLLVLATLALALATGLTRAQGATALTPTVAEKAALEYMRQEEKLARDVYLTLAERWSVPVFRNIARSEQTHMSAVKVLLDRYGIADPVAGLARGDYALPALDSLYAELVAKGSASLAAAAAVGVQIERLDIADLKERLAQTTAADIRLVFTRLARASQNHLAAFTRFA